MRIFHISDILSIVPGRLVSTRHMDGIYDILNFMTGDSLFTHQLPRACRECAPWLIAQYPWLDSPEIQTVAVGELVLMLEGKTDSTEISNLCLGWCSKIAAKFTSGVMELPVHALGAEMHTRIDLIEELEAMVGKDKIIAVGVPNA